jgi:uncharacterized protein DUF3455
LTAWRLDKHSPQHFSLFLHLFYFLFPTTRKINLPVRQSMFGRFCIVLYFAVKTKKNKDMYTQKKTLTKTLLMSTLFLAAVAACKHEDPVPDTTSPNYYITESEKLAIPAAIELPANLPNGNTRELTVYAIGVQKYKSQLVAGSNPARFEWVFDSPEADLYNSIGTLIGKHSAGPTWKLTGDRNDSLVGQQFTPAKFAPSPNPNSIDWLQLMPKAGVVASGIFANVSYIQRIATTGGKAPAALPADAGETVNVGYTAVYRFTKKNP